MANDTNRFQAIISHCKEYGFIFPSSEIYDGLQAVYDYGQMGAELKKNIRDYWWKSMTQLNDNIVGIDAAIFMHPTTWKASGHVDNFNDPMIDNKDSKKRYRVDHLVEGHAEALKEAGKTKEAEELLAAMDALLALIKERGLGLGDYATPTDCRRRIEGDLMTPATEHYLPLPVDTGHFGEDFKWSLLAAVTASAKLDAALDGVAIQSDNWQALNTLREKYREQVKCIYIDPPYNTGGDGFPYKDAYPHASSILST